MSDRLCPLRDPLDERGVSEVVGYVLVFALVISSIGLVTFGGVEALEDARDNERASNAERAFDVVSENMASVYERNSPSRATEIDITGSRLYFGDPVRINVTTVDSTGPTEHYVEETRPIQLQISDERTLVYEAGATFRDRRDGGFTIRDAPFILKEERIQIPIVKTTAEATEAASGTTVLLRGQSTDRSVAVADQSGDIDAVYLNITSPRAGLWKSHLEEYDAVEDDCDMPAENTVVCEVDVNNPTTYVTVQEIEVSIVL